MRGKANHLVQKVVELAKGGMPPRQIYEQLDRQITISSIYNAISIARGSGEHIPHFSRAPSPDNVALARHVIRIHDAASMEVLDRHCRARRLARNDLLQKIVAVVLADDMVNAVLDDGAAK